MHGFRVAHVFDITQTEGDPLPEVRPQLLTGDAPAALWDALAAQVTAHRYALTREACGDANGVTDPTTRTVRVRPDVDPAQAVKTLAHELGHLEAGHTADGYDYILAGVVRDPTGCGPVRDADVRLRGRHELTGTRVHRRD